MKVKHMKNDDEETFHVVLNESNVVESCFDSKIPLDVFGHKYLSPVLRLCEARFQNNECPVESIISTFSSQTFQNPIAKSFAREQSKQGKKFKYI